MNKIILLFVAVLLAMNLFSQSDTTLLTPISGQSKAGQMKNFDGDRESGASELERELSELTGHEVVALQKDSITRKVLTPATGGAIMDGDNPGDRPPEKIFWYPDASKSGKAALKMVEVIQTHHQHLIAQGKNVRILIPWMQGESDISAVTRVDDKAEQVKRYKRATVALFEYVEAELGVELEFFIVLTGFPDEEGMKNRKMSQASINRNKMAALLIRTAQRELIAENDNIHFGGDTDGFETAREAHPKDFPEDVWHLSTEANEKVGVMIAKYIADYLNP